MTRSSGAPRVPGTTLLNIAPRLFSEPFVSAVVQPTIADFQSEVLAAGPSRVRRLRAQCRGCWAFWTLLFVAPFASWAVPSSNVAGVDVARVAIVWAVVMVAAVPMIGAWAALVAAVGTLVAILIHAWYERHPAELPAPSDPRWRSPQINFSSTEVAGNIGGLIFVVGSVLIVSLGIPSIFWFLIAGTVAGGVVAWALAALHTREPSRRLPHNRIVCR
jgi:hypothetical protein